MRRQAGVEESSLAHRFLVRFITLESVLSCMEVRMETACLGWSVIEKRSD